MSQRAVLSGLCAAVAIAAGAWLAVGGWRDEEAPVLCVSPSVSRNTPPSSRDELALPDVAMTPIPSALAVSDSRKAVDAAPRTRVLLRGQLLGTHGLGAEIQLFATPVPASFDDAAAQELMLSDAGGFVFDYSSPAAPFPSNPKPLATRSEFGSLALGVRPGGDVEADVSVFFANPLTAPARLMLHIAHPNFGARQVLVACCSVGGQVVDRAALARGGDFVLPFEVALSAICIARGQAALCDGSAEQVHIAAWDLVDGRPSTPAGRAETYTANGSFSLQLDPGRDYAIVAYADDTAPQTQFVRANGALNIDLPTFQLERGVSIAGRVELGRHSFGNGAWLSAALDQPPTQREFVIGTDLVWNGSVFERRTSTVQAARDGSFTLSGLTRGRYALHLGGARDWTPADTTVMVNAPSSNLLLAPRLVHVTLRLELDQSPLVRHELRVHGVGDCSSRSTPMLQTDAWGRVALWLLPGEQYVVDVPMGERDTRSYGKIVPWTGAEVVEVVSMSSR